MVAGAEGMPAAVGAGRGVSEASGIGEGSGAVADGTGVSVTICGVGEGDGSEVGASSPWAQATKSRVSSRKRGDLLCFIDRYVRTR
jgi:hypothetical protein